MAKDTDNLVLRHLREIRATLDEHSTQLQALPRLEKQMGEMAKLVRYSLGQTTETQFRQTEQEKRIDELFDTLEKILSDEQPV